MSVCGGERGGRKGLPESLLLTQASWTPKNETETPVLLAGFPHIKPGPEPLHFFALTLDCVSFCCPPWHGTCLSLN